MKASASDIKVVNQLEGILKKSRGVISPADAAAATGYPIEQVKDALARLIEIYEARVNMNKENGQIQFVFKYPLFKRGKKTFKEIAQKVLEWAWKAFQIIYKASIGVILIVYTIIFVLILIAIIFGGKSSDRDSKIDIGDILGGLFRGILDIYTFSLFTRSFDYDYDPAGYRYKKFAPEKNKGKRFIKSVFNFVFGPDRPEYNPLDDAMEAAAFIRRNNGKITAGHIIALTGVNYEEAESRLAEYAVRFNGDLVVNTDEGIVVAEFYDMLNKAGKDIQEGKIIFYEDEVEPPYELTGNTGGRNFAIAGMNTFNLIMSLIVISFFSTPYIAVEDPEMSQIVLHSVHEFAWIVYGLGYFPFVFSLLFFIIPTIRAFTIGGKKRRRELDIIRKKLIGAFKRNRGRDIKFSELVAAARIDAKDNEKAKSILQKLVVELKGELNIDSTGEPIYSFPRLSTELGM